MQGYDNTLCSLTMKRPDRPLVPQERHWRPHANAFADITLIDKSTLIERSKLLDAIADDDVIEWKPDPDTGKKFIQSGLKRNCGFKGFLRPAKIPALNFKTLVLF